MYLGRGEAEGQYGRDGKHEPENMLALNCHHTAIGRSEQRETSNKHLHANTRQAHNHIDHREFVSSSTALTWVVWDPSAVYLPLLPLPYYSPPWGAAGTAAVLWLGDGAGRGPAGSWLQPRLPGSDSCQGCCCS